MFAAMGVTGLPIKFGSTCHCLDGNCLIVVRFCFQIKKGPVHNYMIYYLYMYMAVPFSPPIHIFIMIFYVFSVSLACKAHSFFPSELFLSVLPESLYMVLCSRDKKNCPKIIFAWCACFLELALQKTFFTSLSKISL